jgi:hypothetical protein
MNPTIRRPLFRGFMLCLVLCAWSSIARAQFSTNITLNKATYLTNEAVQATVTISNKSGADVVMGGPNGQAWLAFEVTDPSGNRVPPLRLRSDETIVFKAGSDIKRTVLLSDYHTFSEYGSYGVTASVYHPPSQQYFASNRVRATFTEARAFWGKDSSFGVPLGLPGAGQIRHYELSVLRDFDRTYLYVRLIDEKTGLKLATFSLGSCIMVMDPQVTMDSANMLHILFMTLPHTYAHVTVDTQGRIVNRAYFREVKSNRPQLIVQSDKTIAVQGGVTFDPSVSEAAPKGRSIADKPPGL